MDLLKIRLLKSWEHEGTTFEPGQYQFIEVDPATAKSLKDDGTAEDYTETADEAKTTIVKVGEAASSTSAPAGKSALSDADRIEQIVDRVVAKHTDPIRKSIHITESDPDNFNDLSDFFTSVVKFAGGSKIDKRLLPLCGSPVSSTVTKAAGSDEQMEISDPHGGFLIAPQQINELLQVTAEADPIGSRTRSIRMQSPVVEFNARVDKNHSSSVSGGLTLAYVEETAAVTTSRMVFEKVKLEAHELAGATFVTDKLLRDSPLSIVDLLTQGFADEVVAVGLDKRINGVGVGEPLGVLNSGCTVSVAKETGQVATSIVTENVINMRARCWGYGNAVWLANHDTYPQLATMVLNVGTGGQAMYQQTIVEDRPDLLLGRPIFYSEFPKTVGTVGDLILGNWNEYLDGRREDVQTASSIHVRFLNRENCFRFVIENDGQPWWRSALTPKNGSTLSPFVTLATRS